MTRLLSALAGASLLLAMPFAGGATLAQGVSPYQGLEPEQLLDLSLEIPGRFERSAMRKHLADTFPDTPEGLFARTWIEDRNYADRQEVIANYLKVINQRPDFPTAYVYLGLTYEEVGDFDRARGIYEKGLEAVGFETDLIRNLYFLLRGKLKQPAEADTFLQGIERNFGNRDGAVTFIRAIAAQSDGNTEEAEKLFDAALNEGAPFEALKRLTQLRMTRLERSGATAETRAAELKRVLEYAVAERSAEALIFAAGELKDRFNARQQAMKLYEQAYAMSKVAEAALDGFETMASYDFDRSYALLQKAYQDLPHVSQTATYMCWANFSFAIKPDQALAYCREGEAKAVLVDYRHTAVRQTVDLLETLGRMDEGEAALKAVLDVTPSSRKYAMLVELVKNRVWAQDYAKARSYLDEAAGAKGLSGSWLSTWQRLLGTAEVLENERQTFLKANPFLKDWEARIGASLTLAVEFETNSDVIRPDTYPALDKAAGALNAPGGEKYIFLIEGHTDSRGSDEINLPLSARRAQSVAAYLETRHGIPASRLRTAGHGAGQPIAGNDSEAGRQRNRRVEIRPYGNVSAPEIAVTGRLDAGGLRLAPGGRLAATGFEPVQLWDLQQKVKLRDFYRGGDQRAFSPNGRYFASVSKYTEVSGSVTYTLYVYDTKTGHAVAQVHGEAEIAKLAWSPYSDELAYTDAEGFLKIYNVQSRNQRAVTRLSTTRISGPLVWLAGSGKIVAGQAQREGIRVFDGKTLQMERHLPGVDWTHAMGASRDGRYVVAVDNQHQMVIWDTLDWSVVASRSVPVIPKSIAFHPSRPLAVMNDTFNSETGLMLLDLSDGQILAKRKGAQDISLSFTPDGKRIVAGSGGTVEWLDAASLEPVADMTGLAPAGYSISSDKTNALLVSRDSSASHVWDLTTGQRVHTLQVSPKLGWMALEEDGSRQFMVDADNRIVTFSTQDYREEVLEDLGFNVQFVSTSDKYVVFAGQPAGKTDSRTGVLEVRERPSLRKLSRIEFDFVTSRLQYGKSYGTAVNDISISDADGLVALATRWEDGYGHGWTNGKTVRVYEIASGRETKVISLNKEVRDLSFRDEEPGKLRVLEVAGGWRIYDVASGRYEKWEADNGFWTRKLDDGRTIEWSRDLLKLGDRTAFFRGTLRDIEVLEPRNLLVAMTSGNELVYFDLRTLERQLTVVIKNGNEWIAYAPSGEFTSSLGGTDGVFWSLGDNYLPFDALKQRFERPRVIQERLSRLTGEGGTPSAPEPPQVEPELFEAPYKMSVDGPLKASVTEDSFNLKLRIEKADASLPDPELVYTLNGRPVPRGRGFDEEPVYEGGEVIGTSRQFNLQEGVNVIEASIAYRDAKILTQRVEITRTAEAKPQKRASNVQLWFFGVGISDYEIATQNLEYAHKDAQELEKAFKAQEGVLYGKVNTRVLVNDQATERNIRVEMNDFLRQASAEDVIVLFIAGHGVQDNEQQLYLVTHDGDMQRPYTGMQVDKFRDFLEGRPVNQKAVFLMDICHAGTVGPRKRGRVTAEDAVKALTEGTGTIVVASSTGAQSSLEDESYRGGHGAFTAALLEGLDGEADRNAGDANGFTSIQELISYTSRRVPQLTDGAQHPTIPKSENVLDFPVAQAN
ncbi:OmpA family protein [Pannonibacter sp. Pt2]|uniref:OmpA family protein n=1 Tax=Pannonibacter anstelovis TaxID=3121537 RepID=A0ABU7ZNN9_9HYPH